TATSPPIDLTGAVSPQLQFYSWVHTEGSVWDGFNVKVSNNGGTSYSLLTTVSPPYDLTLNSSPSQPAWGGDLSMQGWTLRTADLSAFAGQTIRIRFDFRSDSIIQYDGVYIDDVFVGQ